jgi:arylsulfatase A-like enzyme
MFAKFTRIINFSLALAAFIGGTSSYAQNTSGNKTAKPNIVVILVDQWRGQAQGYMQKEKVFTPNVDALANEGVALTQMVSNYPVCSPARAMFFSGTWPFKNKVHANCNSKSAPYGVALPTDIVCWSDVLKQQGYSNGYIGKWHLDAPYQPYIPVANNVGDVAWDEWTPFDRRHGFDYWYAYNTYDYHNRPMYWDTKAPRDSFHYVDEWGPIHEADKAIDFMDNKGNVRNPNAPFALVVSINPPHSPYNTAPAKYHEPYNNIPLDSLLTDADIPPAGTKMGDQYRKDVKDYYSSITGVDAQIGRIINALKERKMFDNTIIVFIADHGNCLGKHDEESKNNIYEESLHIPFIICWKGKIKPAMDNSFLGSIPDVYPTLLDLAGLKSKIPQSVDGKSYASYFLKGKGDQPSEQIIMGAMAYDTLQKGQSGFRGIRTAQYKLAYQKTKKKTEAFLFDLQADPFEQHNLYSKDNAQVKLMKPKLAAWLKEHNDPFTLD